MLQNYFTFAFIIGSFISSWAQVGINTENPQQSLHIAGATGTLRIESLDSTNNPQNGGDVNGDLDETNDFFPLYVDENGEFTLESQVVVISDGEDIFQDTALPNSSVFLPASDVDGEISTKIASYTISVNRAAILEVKYAISFDVYADMARNPITDQMARLIGNYVMVTGDSRFYGPSTKSYSSRSTTTQVGNIYNGHSTYILLPAAGVYDVSLWGLVSTNLSSDRFTPDSIDTFVEFATGYDFLYIRLH